MANDTSLQEHELPKTDRDPVHLPPAGTLAGLFERQARGRPDAIALVSGAVSLTYDEVNRHATRLARLLCGLGAGPERLVALALPRSLDMVVAMLAVTKTGAAFLPVDPGYPADRIAFMIGDAAPALLCTTSGSVPVLPAGPQRIVLDHPDTTVALRRRSDSNLAGTGALSRAELAYVIYTSGSTGTPKGVAVTHAGVTSLAAANSERMAVNADSRVLQFS